VSFADFLCCGNIDGRILDAPGGTLEVYERIWPWRRALERVFRCILEIDRFCDRAMVCYQLWIGVRQSSCLRRVGCLCSVS